MDTVKVKQCIVCTKGRRGSGSSPMSPVRALTEVFDLDGNLIAEIDPYSITIESLIDFIHKHFEAEEREKVLGWAYHHFVDKGKK